MRALPLDVGTSNSSLGLGVHWFVVAWARTLVSDRLGDPRFDRDRGGMLADDARVVIGARPWVGDKMIV